MPCLIFFRGQGVELFVASGDGVSRAVGVIGTDGGPFDDAIAHAYILNRC